MSQYFGSPGRGTVDPRRERVPVSLVTPTARTDAREGWQGWRRFLHGTLGSGAVQLGAGVATADVLFWCDPQGPCGSPVLSCSPDGPPGR